MRIDKGELIHGWRASDSLLTVRTSLPLPQITLGLEYYYGLLPNATLAALDDLSPEVRTVGSALGGGCRASSATAACD